MDDLDYNDDEDYEADALTFDEEAQERFLKYWRKIPEKPATTVRFFNHTEYYTLHNDDAKFGAEQGFTVNNEVKQMIKDPELTYLCLFRDKFEEFVRTLLLVMQYRVEVYARESDDSHKWILDFKGSPGNLTQFETILFTNPSNAVINSKVMGIKLCPDKILAVSCANLTDLTFQVVEFHDNEFYTELESVLVQISPKECVIPAGDTPELIRLTKILERSHVIVVTVKNSDFEANSIVQDLDRLLYFESDQLKNSVSLMETKHTNAMCSLNAVIKYLNVLGDKQNFNQFKMSEFDRKQYVRLDNAAVNALNVVLKPGQKRINKYDTLFGVLDTTCTNQGKRLLDQWMKQPLRDIHLINERLDVIEAFVNDSETRTHLSTVILNRIPDLLWLSKKIGGNKANLEDCYKVFQTINGLPALAKSLNNFESVSAKALMVDPINDVLEEMTNFQIMIRRSIDLDLVDKGEFLINPSFDDELSGYSDHKMQLEKKIQECFVSVADDLNMEIGKIKLDKNDAHGQFFKVTLKEGKPVKNNKKYTVLDATSAGVRFQNDELIELDKTLKEVIKNYEQRQEGAVRNILEVAAGYADAIRNLNHVIGIVDVLVAISVAAATAPITYVRPKLLAEGSGILNLKQARHPCLERVGDNPFIPNDVHFKQNERVVHILTGPNMGGKSTFMRTVGASVLLAHIGSFVPCDEAEISVVDCILARVGSDDSELFGLSTFMMEMVETCGLVRSVSSNSLVLVDELGRGTSTYDGCGIAWSIVDFLAVDVKAFTLFATHYHELLHLEEEIPTISNLHVSAIFANNTITPLYQVTQGTCDKSYGIHCAKMSRFPEDTIQLAIKHQAILENEDGMKYMKAFNRNDKRKMIDEGDNIIDKFIKEFENQDLTDEEIINKVKNFKTGKEGNNLFIKGLISKSEEGID